jgi:hypothetical protein
MLINLESGTSELPATTLAYETKCRKADVTKRSRLVKLGDAQSKVIREKSIEWYRSTLVTRPDDKKATRIVVVMQRVHHEDLVGYLLQEGGFEVLNLPAIALKQSTNATGPADPVRTGDQSEDCQSDRPRDPGRPRAARRQGDRVIISLPGTNMPTNVGC